MKAWCGKRASARLKDRAGPRHGVQADQRIEPGVFRFDGSEECLPLYAVQMAHLALGRSGQPDLASPWYLVASPIERGR